MRRQIIADCETTSLTPGYDTGTGVIWELALVERSGSGRSEALWRLQPDELEIASASTESLEVGRFAERTAGMLPAEGRVTNLAVPGSPQRWSDPLKLAEMVAAELRDVTIIGANPGFDAGFLAAFLAHYGLHYAPGGKLPWHYRLRDIGSIAYGYLAARRQFGTYFGEIPPIDASTDTFALALGIDPEKYERHSALGDCRLVADMLDVTEGAR